MSSPSTPHSTRSASRPPADSPTMLTPGQKIKAMMAAFDSDSESESNGTSNTNTNTKSKPKPQATRTSIFNRPQFATQSDPENNDNDNEGEDDDIIMPRGRMAARLQAENGVSGSASAIERVSKSLKDRKEQEDMADSEDDDIPTAGPRRRLANARISNTNTNTQTEEDSARTPERERSFSPLFVSPRPREDDQEDGSDSDRPQPKRNSRFEALIAQKRAEREEKEKLERQKKLERAEAAKLAAMDDGEDEEDDDAEMQSSLPARPARKASRKALEDMNRETQRMSRSLQLAHQATTSKKISKESFFARFNFMQPEQKGSSADNSSSMAGSQDSSDEEAQKNRETPQTSPVMGPSDKPTAQDASAAGQKESQFPSLEKMVEQTQQQQEQPVVARVEDHATNPAPDTVDVKGKKKLTTAPPVHVRLSRQAVAQNQMDDSDSDLEVVTSPAKSRRLAAFENVPSKKVQESSALLKLKALAHLTSPTRRTTMNNAELSANMLYQAKKQAAKERQEKIAELRAKGVIIETAAERAALEDELENLVEKARKEAEDIAKQERASKKANGDLGDDDDEEDEDYDGSEDEANDDGEEDEDENEGGEKEYNLFDSEAGEEESEAEDDQDDMMSTGEPETTTQRRKRPTRVIEDDDDEEQVPTTPARPINATPVSVERPQIPGLPSNDMTMSLTQVFAGTLGSQQDSQPPSSTIPHSLPDPAQRGEWQESDSQVIVKDSQEPSAETTDFLARYTPSDARVSESPAPRGMSQFSQIPDPTQDEGFVYSPFDPSKRFMSTPASTVETVLVDRNQSNSPVADRKMKHLRRGRNELSAIEEESGFEVEASAFNVMKKAAKPSVAFDRKKSKAKDVVEEAAEESEDEYAGLGGASDEEDEEENAFDRQMINDNSGETVDEKQLAALNAQHQRTTDEKQVAKLMRDITTGALRRRRGADDEFDLDDSDDELLARRRQKQREFARMRNALMADGKVGELAENPKKAAFFRAIEDHDSDDDLLDFLDEEGPGSQNSSSQDVNAEQGAAEASNKRKRPLELSAEETYNRPPPNLRRRPASAMSKKPASLAEIRETLSFLTERPKYDSFHEDASMEDEQEEPEEPESVPEEPQEEFMPRVHPRRTKGPVVDRLALLRQASSNSATSSSTRFAFHAGSGAQGSNIGFRPPPMLRKTTSSSTGSSKPDSRRASTASGASTTKKGAVNYYTAAREREREKELRTQNRAGASNITKLLNKHAGNRLGALGGTGQWD